ncbi:metallophosphoesterase family protein [Seongchinamella sediminis]|uniref:Metallophosphoesterase family protein n=1 Tax=Seongchinamella sediminis TaxID=2283635 RepID=A0A3L7DZ13_9GAMM|nr:metallophosphoesterase family protein [Seongchinamella sediminis]RLQ21373.1 metallophosphoesterase family protein [Seongchinamella sediminis]
MKRSGFTASPRRLVHLGLAVATITLAACSTPGDRVTANCNGTEVSPERLFLQQLGSDRAIIKWRGNASGGASADQLCFGKDSNALPLSSLTRASETGLGHREAVLEGLEPETTYYYSIGGAGTAAPGQSFRTAPVADSAPVDGNTHILIVGDSGTPSEGVSEKRPGGKYPGQAAAVLKGYQRYAAAQGGEDLDLFLLLGDNAYEAGTDAQWQLAFFDLYADIIKRTQTLPTIGNHEMGVANMLLPGYLMCELMHVARENCGDNFDPPGDLHPMATAGTSTSSDPASYSSNGRSAEPDGTSMPYLDIFSLPTRGEMGGVPSGTEQYYSVDYANVHVVSLDSQLSARDATARDTMKRWLIEDLSANTRDWTIVIFHHPPYTKGANHDSDDVGGSSAGATIDRPEWDMRNEFTPVFEQYGVDLVYSGHAHSYERSYYLQGHTGTSDTFDPLRHAETVAGRPATGRPADGETYRQKSPTSGNLDDRVVYTVAGSSGKADKGGDQLGITADDEWLRHPAHVIQPLASSRCQHDAGCREGLRGLAVLGSVVVDAGRSSLRARFIDTHGDVLDEFVIQR